jgi:hypothetical protein
MPQVKVYGNKEFLNDNKQLLSGLIHECIVNKLQFPKDKKYHRFIGLDSSDFVIPNEKSENILSLRF